MAGRGARDATTHYRRARLLPRQHCQHRRGSAAMSDTVVDSSVVAKWIIAEPDSAQAQRLISEVAQKGERLIVLDLAFVEVTNAIWKLHHRGLATLDEVRQFLDKLLHIPVHVEPANRLLKPALE